jgi:hypothetical protein
MQKTGANKKNEGQKKFHDGLNLESKLSHLERDVQIIKRLLTKIF